jgi:hypothetical protein
MKIYNRIVMDMNTWEVLEEDSYEYDGPLALCGGGSSEPDPVYPTATELAIQQLQLSSLQEQAKENAQLKPLLYASMGLTTDASGNIRKMTEDEYQNSLTDTQKLAYKAEKLQQERVINALEGKLPVSTVLENDIADREKVLRETLAQKLGGNYETSTPGIQALSEFNKKADELREQSRLGEITSGTGLMLNQMGFLDSSAKSTTSMFGGLPSRYGTQVATAGQALQPYQYYNGLNSQIAMQNAQNENQYQSGLMGGIGSLVGAGMGAFGNYMGLSALKGVGKLGGL